MNSKIQELESQLRTSKVEFDGKIRIKDKTISELEEKCRILEERAKTGDSRVTGLGNTSYTPSSSAYSSSVRDGMSASQHSETGSEASDLGRQYGNYNSAGYRQSGTLQGTTAQSGLSGSGASYGNLSGSGASYGQRSSAYQSTGATGATSVLTSGSNISGSTSGIRTSGTTSGATYGTSGTTYGTTGSSGLTSGQVSGGLTGGATYGTSGARNYSSTSGSNLQGSSTSGTTGSYTRYQPQQ